MIKKDIRDVVDKIEVSQSKSSLLLITGISIFIFFVLFIPSHTTLWAILLMLVDLIFLFINKQKKIKKALNISLLLWSIFIVIGFIDLNFNVLNPTEGFQFMFALLLFVTNYFLLLMNNNWAKKIINILFVISMFFVIGLIIQLYNPDIVMYINNLHFDNEKTQIAHSQYIDGYYTGFTYQTGVNAYIISVFMSIIFIRLFICKGMKTKLFLFTIYASTYFLLFMTGKRSFIIFNMIIFIIFFMKFKKNLIKKIMPILFIIIFVYLILNFTEIGLKILRRIAMSDDLTSGRSSMNRLMWNDFLKNPLWGSGTYSTAMVVDSYNGHNIYLQVLRENGLIGFIPFILVITYNLYLGFNNIEMNKRRDNDLFVTGVSLYLQLIFIFWGFTGNPLYDTYSLMIYFVCIAINRIELKKTKNIWYF